MATEVCPECYSIRLSRVDDYVECLSCGAQMEEDELDEIDDGDENCGIALDYFEEDDYLDKDEEEYLP